MPNFKFFFFFLYTRNPYSSTSHLGTFSKLTQVHQFCTRVVSIRTGFQPLYPLLLHASDSATLILSSCAFWWFSLHRVLYCSYVFFIFPHLCSHYYLSTTIMAESLWHLDFLVSLQAESSQETLECHVSTPFNPEFSCKLPPNFSKITKDSL